MEGSSSLRDRLDSAVIIAAVSLWLYLVATSYLDGYLSVFNARAEWFSPSIFQLVALANRGIFLATVLGVLMFAMIRTRNRRALLIYCAIWVCITSAIAVMYASCVAHVPPMIPPLDRRAMIWIGLIATPVGLCVVAYVGPPVISRLIPVGEPTPRQAAMLDGVERFGKVFPWIVGAYMLWLISDCAVYTGAMSGAIDLTRAANSRVATVDDLAKYSAPILSDGVRAIAFERGEFQSGIVYRDATSGTKVWLRFGVEFDKLKAEMVKIDGEAKAMRSQAEALLQAASQPATSPQ